MLLAEKKMISKLFNLFLTFIIFSSAAGWAQQRTFNPSGYFVPKESERNASKVRWILLSDYPREGNTDPMWVELRIGTEVRWKTFSQSSLMLKDYKISFKTKSLNGLRYEFEGQFYPTKREKKEGSFIELSNANTALSGVLTTKRGRRTLRSEQLVFYYTIGD